MSLQRKSRSLDRWASGILAGLESRDLVKARTGNSVALTAKQTDKRIAQRNRKKLAITTAELYRELPKERRRALSAAFQRERERKPSLNWSDWLIEHEEQLRGMPMPGTPSVALANGAGG